MMGHIVESLLATDFAGRVVGCNGLLKDRINMYWLMMAADLLW